ncbi:MAG: hypothetical protein ACHQ02_06405 [Candidatus Limnocylindrales bacterium]
MRGAIALVASHQASRVTLSGLRFGERLLPRVTAEGVESGVVVTVDRGVHGTTAIVVSAADR